MVSPSTYPFLPSHARRSKHRTSKIASQGNKGLALAGEQSVMSIM